MPVYVVFLIFLVEALLIIAPMTLLTRHRSRELRRYKLRQAELESQLDLAREQLTAVLSANRASQVPPQHTNVDKTDPSQSGHHTTINISGGTFGQLNAAVEALHVIESRLTAISDRESPQLADAFQALSRAVLDDPALHTDAKVRLMDNLEDLSAAAQEPASRRKAGRIAAAIQAISSAAIAGTRLHDAWQAWAPTLAQLVTDTGRIHPT